MITITSEADARAAVLAALQEIELSAPGLYLAGPVLFGWKMSAVFLRGAIDGLVEDRALAVREHGLVAFYSGRRA